MKQELIWLTRAILRRLSDIWDEAENRKIVSYRLCQYFIGDISDIIDIIDNCEKYE